jgi:S-adenosylmethionine hydrolase
MILEEEHARPAAGKVLHIDRFGNVITNLRLRSEAPLALQRINIGRRTVSRWVATYEEAPQGTVCAIKGSSGLLEIVVRNGNAARELRAHPGIVLRFQWGRQA